MSLAESAGTSPSTNTNPIVANDQVSNLAPTIMDSDFIAPSSTSGSPIAPATESDWFLAPETWRITHREDGAGVETVGVPTMKNYVALLQAWFERWIAMGNNPFIHLRLYSVNFPTCVQVAYVTLTSYVHRTPANTHTVLQIVEGRSKSPLKEPTHRERSYHGKCQRRGMG